MAETNEAEQHRRSTGRASAAVPVWKDPAYPANAGAVDLFSGVLEHRRCDPDEGDYNTGEGGIEVTHLVEVIELVKVTCFPKAGQAEDRGI